MGSPYHWYDSSTLELVLEEQGGGVTFAPMVKAYSVNSGYGLEYNGAPFALPTTGTPITFDTAYLAGQGVTSTPPGENDLVQVDATTIVAKVTGLYAVWFEVDLDAVLTKPLSVRVPGPFQGASYVMQPGTQGIDRNTLMFLAAEDVPQKQSLVLKADAADSGVNVTYAALTVNAVLLGTREA